MQEEKRAKQEYKIWNDLNFRIAYKDLLDIILGKLHKDQLCNKDSACFIQMLSIEDNTFLNQILDKTLLGGAARVALAVSGGADSVAMAHLLVRLAQQGRLSCGFMMAHINHHLRGAASDADERFVQSLAASLGVPFMAVSAEVRGYAATHKLSIETAARRLRLAALADIARQHGCEAVATAHHADDQAETMIHRLLRGTSLRGLCGIRPATMHHGLRFVRPMLSLRRTQIEAYCGEHHLNWMHDHTNDALDFTRNRIRHRLLPELRRDCPDIVERLVRLAELSLAAQQRVEAAAAEATVNLLRLDAHPAADAKRIAFDRGGFAAQSPWVQAELLTQAVQDVGGGLRDITMRHYQSLMAAAAQKKTLKTLWPGRIQAAVTDDRVILSGSYR